MKRLLKAVALSTCCLISVTGCKPAVEYRFKPIPIPAERMDCTAVDKSDRPKLGALYTIDWSKVTSVPQAQIEVGKLMTTMINRETTVTNYILDIEGKLFLCASDAQWLREYTAKTAE